MDEKLLLEIYRKAYIRILINIAKSFQRGTKKSYTYDYELLNNVKKEIAKLDVNVSRFCDIVIKKIYEETQQEELLKLGLDKQDYPNFALLNDKAIKLLTNDLKNDLIALNTKIGDGVKSTIDKITTEATLQKITTNTTNKKLFNETVSNMLSEGIKTFVDSSGKEWDLLNYVSMAVQTKQTITANTAIIHTADELDTDLVIMSYHASSCPICAKYEGRIYSVSGQDKRYPKLSIAFNEYNTIHPRCRHRISVYIEEGYSKSEQKKQIKDSNRPFIDDRSENRKELYKKRLETKQLQRKIDKQKIKVELLKIDENTKKQYQREKAKLMLMRKDYDQKSKEINEWEID